MKVLSLFSGGGLGDYGLELAGMEVIGQVEIDPYCQKILKLRWPDVPKWKDIRDVRGEEILAKVGRVDLISGGFPCQDISNAGNRAGIKGQQSGLWKEMFRVICEVRPKYVFVENVSALLGRGLGTVLGDLAEIGYDCEWDCIPANSIGAPHIRDRVFIVAKRPFNSNTDSLGHKIPELTSQGHGCRQQPLDQLRTMGEDLAYSDSKKSERLPKRKEKEHSESGIASQDVADTRCEYEQGNTEELEAKTPKWVFCPVSIESSRKRLGRFWESEPNVGRVAHGVASRVDRLKLLGNGQVVQVVQWIGERIIEFEAVDGD